MTQAARRRLTQWSGGTALARGQDACSQEKHNARGAVEQRCASWLLQPRLCTGGRQGIDAEPKHLEEDEGEAQHKELWKVGFVWRDELRKERAKEQKRFGIACANQKALAVQAAARSGATGDSDFRARSRPGRVHR